MDFTRVALHAARKTSAAAKEQFCQGLNYCNFEAYFVFLLPPTDYIGAKCVPDSWETLEYCCVTLDCQFNKPLNGYFCECEKYYKPNENPNTDNAC
jgi:hypothetical protein